MCLRMNSPATSRVGSGGCPGPTRQTEPKRPAKNSQSISAARRTNAHQFKRARRELKFLRTLGPVIGNLEKLTGVAVRRVHGDKGYRGHNYPGQSGP